MVRSYRLGEESTTSLFNPPSHFAQGPAYICFNSLFILTFDVLLCFYPLQSSFDGSKGWAQRPRLLPELHPDLDNYFLIAEPPVGMTTSVYSSHPDVDIQYAAGVAVPEWHPNVSFPTGALPSTHPNVNAMLRDPANNPLPAWHPSIRCVSSIRY